MRVRLQRLKSRNAIWALWLTLNFALTSAVYLSWLDRLVGMAGGAIASWLSMGAGYFCQAAGMGAAMWMRRRDPNGDGRRFLWTVALLFAAVCPPLLLTQSLSGLIGFGMAMNLLCGGLQGYYMHAIAANVDAAYRARVFGCGYALGTVAVGLLALVGKGALLHSRYALLICVPLSVALPPLTSRLLPEDGEGTPAKPAPGGGPPLALACAVALLVSAVVDMGAAFPMNDVGAGAMLELWRMPYAVGLAMAGMVYDRNRKKGMICTVAALILPFIMLGLDGEPVSGAICWGLDYLFFGFFALFRAVIFMDLAERTGRAELAPLGLLAGRLGEAAGACVGLALAGHKIALIAVTALTFFPTVFLFFRLYQKLYEPENVRQRSEQEVFEAFCLRNDLSAREREVLRMVIDNRSNGEIAEALFITESTVKYHVRNVLQKAGCKNRGELQKKYMLALYPQLQADVPAMEGMG